jgi:membrane associated rhomboid family serine protease
LTLPPDQQQAREPIVRAPRVVLISLLILAAIHVARLILTPESDDALIQNLGFVPAHVQSMDWSHAGLNAATFWTLVPFLTYALLHGNFLHLAVNGLAFLIFATVVARRIGAARFFALTLVATIAAVLAHLFTNWGAPTPVIGASGAIAGYMGAASRFIFVDPRNPTAGPGQLLPLFSRPVVVFALVWTGINIAFGATGFSPDESQDLTAWQAHLGGFYAGLLLFPLFDRRRNLPD